MKVVNQSHMTASWTPHHKNTVASFNHVQYKHPNRSSPRDYCTWLASIMTFKFSSSMVNENSDWALQNFTAPTGITVIPPSKKAFVSLSPRHHTWLMDTIFILQAKGRTRSCKWQSHNLNYHLVQSCSNPVSQNQRLQEKSSDVPDLPVILQQWALETQLHAPGPSWITSPTDLDMLPFIVLSFKILLHTLNFLSSTERCKELSTTHKDIRMPLKWT